jgi:preprotein translocase SecE subunit
VASKTSKKDSETATNITRVKAVDTTPDKKGFKKSKSIPDSTTEKPKKSVLVMFKPFVLLGRYFKGSWYELRQVRWPDRKATWSLTVAVLLFTAFFIVLIVSLDAFYKFLFQQILG